MRRVLTTLLFVPTLLRAQEPTITIHAAKLLDGRGGSVTNAIVTVQGKRIIKVERATPGRCPECGTEAAAMIISVTAR